MTKARDLANLISGGLTADEIPDLPASKITSGTLASARLSLSVPSARLSLSASDVPDLATSKITSGTFADARLSSSSVTQHVDLSNLNASNLTSGSIPNARVPSGSVTQHVSAVTQAQGSWTPAVNSGGVSASGRYTRVGNIVTCVGHGYWTSRTAESNDAFIMSGLPVTANSNGTSAGDGRATFHYQTRGNIACKVIPNTTTVGFYAGFSNIATTSSISQSNLGQALAPTYDAGGYRLSKRNFRDSSETTSQYFSIFLVYQV